MKLTLSAALVVVAVLATGIRAQEDGVIIPNFPYCACKESPAAYFLEPVVTSKGANTYCFRVKVNPPIGCTDYCCAKADLKKIEMDANPACKIGGVKLSATINGKPSETAPLVDRSFAGPAGTFVLKLTNIGLNLTTANGAEICYTLGTNAAGQGCTTLEQMCIPPAGSPPGVCQAALFDTQNDCCPISNPGKPSPPPPKPPSPPPPKPPPCKVCTYVNLVPPAMNPFNIGFGPADCARISTSIINDIVMSSASADAAISSAFVQVSCSATTIKICGEFASSADGAKLTSSLDDLMSFWLALVTPTDQCEAKYSGFTIQVFVGGDGALPPPPSCLSGTKSVQCAPGTPDFPKCQCDTARYATPFAVDPVIKPASIPAPAGSYLRCFVIKVVQPLLGSPCADTKTMSKIEFWANDKIRRKILAFYVKPATRSTYSIMSTSWGAVGDDTLKATPLNWNTTQADGAQVCFQMNNDTPLDKFCLGGAKSCWSNIFDPTRTCCPLYASSV